MGVVVKEVVNDDGIVCCSRGLRPITFLVGTPLLLVLAALLLYDIDARWYDRYVVVVLMMMALHRCCNSETDRNESIL